jgi:hypothetical protein
MLRWLEISYLDCYGAENVLLLSIYSYRGPELFI